MLTEAEARKLPVTLVPLALAVFDPRVQSRAATDADQVAYFTELLLSGGETEPGVFFKEGRRYLCGSGFQRGEGYTAAGRSHMPAHVVPGTLEDAILFSAGSNKLPGCLRRTNADKRRAVRMTLAHPRVRVEGWSEIDVAEHTGVSRHLVQAVKEEGGGGTMPPGQDGESGEGGADPETRGRRLGQLPRSARRLLEKLERAGSLRRGLAKELAELAGLPESVARAAMKVVSQAQEIHEDPLWWVQDAMRRRAERVRKR